jgi:hypothetical protein
MGDYVTIIFLLILGFSGVFVLQRFKALEKQIKNLEGEREQTNVQVTDLKSKLNRTERKLSEKTEAFIKLREQHKKAKARIHNASTNKGGARSASGKTDSEAMIAFAKSRSELVKAQAEIDKLQGQLKELDKALRVANKQEKEEKVLPEEPVESSGDLKKALSNRTKADKIRMASLKRDHLDEVDYLTRRLNRALRDRDTQRRRGDNNEKAYNITKNQLESALDRLHQFDPSIPRPFVLPPEVAKKLREKEEAELLEKAEAVDDAAVETPELQEAEKKEKKGASKKAVKSKKGTDEKRKAKKPKPKKGIVQAGKKPSQAEEKPAQAEEKPAQEAPDTAEESVPESAEQEAVPPKTDETESR